MDHCKIGRVVGDQVEGYRYPNVWAAERVDGQSRLVIAPSTGHVGVMLALMRALPEPFAFLYVALVPRGDHPMGRYESAPVDRRAAEGFLVTYAQLFEDDGGHHLWVASLAPERDADPIGQLIYDQHDLIYAYGPLHDYEDILSHLDLTRIDGVAVPEPHVHRRNPELAADYDALFDHWDWLQTPLLAEDDE